MNDKLKRCLCLLVVILLWTSAHAQVTDMDSISAQFDRFKRRTQKEFAEFLKQSWQEFQLVRGEDPPARPEPISPCVAEPEIFNKLIEIPSGEIIIPGVREAPPLRKPSINKPAAHYGEIAVDIFGSSVYLPYDKSFFVKLKSTRERDIGEFWGKLAEADVALLLYSCLLVKDALRLNDWGYYQLVKELASRVYPATMENERTLFTAFVLDETGFDVRFALVTETNKLVMMLSFTNKVYSFPYLDFPDQRYFMPGFNREEKISTYRPYPKAMKRSVDLCIREPMRLKENEGRFEIGSELLGMPLKITYNQNVIDFYKDIPATGMDVYFNSQGSTTVYQSLFSALKPLVEKKSEKDAVNSLLRLVQHAFRYKNDEEQFGYERAFFYEELFSYPYSDCEDRSVLFAFLVRKLLGLEVLGLEFPGHIATAVKFTEEVNGNFVSYRGDPYIICDPTYIDATAGQCMPGLETNQPRLVVIDP